MADLRSAAPESRLRPDFLPKDAYVSRDFLALEKARLWPRVWQVACREEELANVGDYVTYDVHDESIIVVRSAPGAIRAWHNVCQHRGRRLTAGCGHLARFHCGFHGWQWHLDGSVARIKDEDDWRGCPGFGSANLRLREVRCESWQGFVFVNLDAGAEPLARFLDPVPAYLDPFELGRMRYRWHKLIKVPCNWKVALEAFDEGYHAFATHPQMMSSYGDDTTRSFAFGRHSMFTFSEDRRPTGAPASRTGRPMPDDLRPGLVESQRILNEQLRSIISERDYHASARLLSEVPANAPPAEVFARLTQFHREAAIAAGAGWPDITPEQMAAAGLDWHLFPNFIVLPYADGALMYRARPHGDDPDWCLFDIWALERYAPGAEPPLVREAWLGDRDWCEDVVAKVGVILAQDLANMHEVQRGMKSSGFSGSRTNPLQETAVYNLHRSIREFISAGDGR
ncbi:MAG: SRPBCC family protein [Gammaproteobacteria bacterium]